MTPAIHSILSATALMAAVAAAPMSARGEAPGDDWRLAQDRADVAGVAQLEARQELNERRERLIADAITALDETEAAIAALETGDAEDAIERIAVATGKLETLMARSPELGFAPVDISYSATDMIGTLQDVRDVGNRIEDLIDEGAFQSARVMLDTFASELVMRTVYLPLATYPDALVRAAALVDQGETDAALAVLRAALSTLVVTEEIVPLPPIRAQEMIAQARGLIEGAGEGELSENDARAVRSFVTSARTELRIAEAFGYGDEEAFEALHESLDDLEDAVRDAEGTSGLLDRIGAQFRELRERLSLGRAEI